MKKIRLADVHNLDSADQITRVAQLFPSDGVKIGDPNKVRVVGYGLPEGTPWGELYWTCHVETEWPDGSGRRYDRFELKGRRSEVARILSREVRDVANDVAELLQ